jgi:hypothetical protein
MEGKQILDEMEKLKVLMSQPLAQESKHQCGTIRCFSNETDLGSNEHGD